MHAIYSIMVFLILLICLNIADMMHMIFASSTTINHLPLPKSIVKFFNHWFLGFFFFFYFPLFLEFTHLIKPLVSGYQLLECRWLVANLRGKTMYIKSSILFLWSIVFGKKMKFRPKNKVRWWTSCKRSYWSKTR